MIPERGRRGFLSRGVALLGGLAALAGCTEERLVEAEREPPPLEGIEHEELDLPVEQRLAIAGEAIERAAGEAFGDLAALETYLVEQDLTVEDLAEDETEGEPVVALESVFEQTSERGFLHHLGIVAGGYAALIRGTHGSERTHGSEKLEATLLDADSRPFGEYEVRRHWAEAYDEGELTAREYANEVAATAASV